MAWWYFVGLALIVMSEHCLASAIPPPDIKNRVLEKVCIFDVQHDLVACISHVKFVRKYV